MKYLGFVLDKKLTWVPHLTAVRDNTNKIMNSLNRMMSAKWQLKGSLLKDLYLRAVERMILYGSPVWMTNTVRVQTKLAQIQRIALLKITAAFTTTSTAALQVLAGVLPLDLIAQKEKLQYRLQHYQEDASMEGTTIVHYQTIERYRHDATKHPAEIRNIIWRKEQQDGSHLEIFTDGSGINNQIGAAFVAFLDNRIIHTECYRLPDTATVFQAESYALRQAALWAGNQPSSHHVKFYTDSMSALQALNKRGKVAEHIASLKEVLHTLNTEHEVKINWVRGHAGLRGNETADTLAKDAANCSEVDSCIPISIITAKKLIDNYLLTVWQERWEEEDKGRHTFQFFDKVSYKRLRSDHHLSQALTNHGKFPAYYRRFLNRQAKCACGTPGHQADVFHYIFDCQLLDDLPKQDTFQTTSGTFPLSSLVNDFYLVKGIHQDHSQRSISRSDIIIEDLKSQLLQTLLQTRSSNHVTFKTYVYIHPILIVIFISQQQIQLTALYSKL
ncbi:uncharacterized protein LOC118188390 [Stegodyphus dumicola]|uniref:uncharacterized protein LOC118188390 n=1 Tax=Stegodyphus dumicola TaxID=202533 RepID=UPI0015B07AB7|nr:uncharacterized protein LOC118188390 [Stegodyphus dumicola]